jgi:Tol biopolymer transport system component
MRLEAGSRLGPYEISGPIGVGGMGEVYRARDTRLGREVAIKVLPREVSADAERLARFEREARSASALNHRNIVTIHDFTSGDGEAWLVMELIRGESLRAVMSRGALPLKKLIAIAGGVADGLAAAHAAGIVHRDLKPENIMIAGDGTPKILDFGLVKLIVSEGAESRTDLQVSRSGLIVGTASYMSPEQARGADVDFRTDHFSLGLILYEMATGKHPFRRATAAETLAAILNEEPESLGDSFPEPFVAIVERCLAKNPAERYGSTIDLAHDLARVVPASGRPAGRRDGSTTPVRMVAAAIVAIVLVVFAVATWRRSKATVADPLSVAIATPEIGEVNFGEVSPPISLSPDGRYMIIAGRGVDGTEGLWLHDLRAGTTRLIAENGFASAWSSDGKAIAYFAEEKLKTVGLEGGPPRTVCEARPEGTPTWHGDTILFTQYSKGPGVYRVNASGGAPVPVIHAERFPWWPQFLPDGKHFLFLRILEAPERRDINHELAVGSLDGAAPTRVMALDSRAEFVDGHLLFVRDGTLMAQPFDPDRLRLTGEAKPIVSGLHYFRSTGLASFSASQNGMLAWRSAQQASHLVLLDRSGFQVRSIATAPLDPNGRLSPDGNRYAVGVVDPKQGVSDVWIYDLTRESAERVTFRLLDEKSPVWAPDGQTLYYRSDGAGGPPDVFRWDFARSDGEPMYRGPGVEEPQDVSPDGKSLLFIDYNRTNGTDVMLLPLSPPGPPQPFVMTPFNESSPRFSPDGRWVAYTSDISGKSEVYVRAFKGSASATRISKDGGTRPRWRRDGRELFFLARGGRLMTAPIRGSLDAGTPRMLFQAADAVDYEPTTDGSRFIVQLEERSTDPVRLLVNWPERLRHER